MKRIAYICADRGVPVYGRKGSSIHVQEVLRHLLAGGATIDLFARRIGGDPPDGLEGVRLHRLPKSPRGEDAVRERADLDANDAIESMLEREGPFDLAYERHSLWSYAGMEYARHAGVPGLLEVNAPLLEEQRKYRKLVLEHEAEQAVARAYGAASALLAVSDGVGQYLENHEAARGRVYVVPNGVDPRRFDSLTERRTDGGAFIVGFVGTLKPWHGVEELLRAFAELQRRATRARLRIVGDGPMREDLVSQAAELGISENVTFVGAVDPADIPVELALMDAAVAPYPHLEDFYFSPLKVFEYMAAGRAIVASAIGQITCVLDDGTTGLLYPPNDTAGLAAALGRLESDPALVRQLGTAARSAAMRDHTWQAVVDRIDEIASSVDATRPMSSGTS